MKMERLNAVNRAIVPCSTEYVARYPSDVLTASGVVSLMSDILSDHTASQLLAKTYTATTQVIPVQNCSCSQLMNRTYLE